MRVAGGRAEDGIVIGNTYDKYGTSNPVARWLMNGFDEALTNLVETIAPESIHEVGCGEGYWVSRWTGQGIDARGTDFSTQVIDMARTNARARGQDETRYEVRSLYDVTPERDSAALIVCCEVMEHLEEPERALGALQSIVTDDLIVSVPREPLWRVLNVMRGKYLADFGNTPGHLQHWSTRSIASLLGKHFEVVKVLTPLPWSMIHCRRRTKN